MFISYKTDYALKTLLELAKNYEGRVLTIPEMAKNLDIPKKFLEQILLSLKKGGFIASKRGPTGGYYLNIDPAKLTLGQVLRFIEGPLEPIACVNNNYKGCNDLAKCVLRQVWVKTAKATSEIVDNITIEDLIKDIQKRKAVLSFSI